MARLRDLTRRTDQVIAAEELSRLGAQLTADIVFIEPIVTVDDHFIDRGLWAFLYADFKRDRVVLHLHFDGVGVEEEVTVVVVDVRDGVVVGL